MDFDDTPDEAAFRSEVRAWLQKTAPWELEPALRNAMVRTTSSVHLPEIPGATNVLDLCKAWQKKKFEAGWACLHWPARHGGRDAKPIERVIWQQEEGPFVLLSHVFSVGHGMAGPTLMAHGTSRQQDAHLRKIASGEHMWCQLFSEPSGGSDLAGLRSRAERIDAGWRLNGQKIWTTHAHRSDFGLLLARTDTTVSKHKGLTMFMIDMKSPGVEVRTIKDMAGGTAFNEVFFTDAIIPDDCRIGDAGNGWKVALTTLMNERLLLGAAAPTGVPEMIRYCLNLELEEGLAIDRADVRDRLARWIARAEGLKNVSMRTISSLSSGRQPGPENSIGKLVAGEMVQEIAAYAMELAGPAGAIMDADAGNSNFPRMLLRAPAVRIGGGTTEIQKNIIGEQVLGLPPEVRVDKDAAFKDLR